MRWVFILFFLCGSVVAWSLFNEVEGPAIAVDREQAEKAIRDNLNKAIPHLSVTAIHETEIPGLFEVVMNHQLILYVSQDGNYMIAGRDLSLYDLSGGGLSNLTANRNADGRRQALAEVPASEMVVYQPDGEVKSQVYIFTDVDCGFCRKLHSHMAEINALGIQVNYLAFPRMGPDSSTADKLKAVWCAKDRTGAMNLAKAGNALSGYAKDCDNPVAGQWELGQMVGVTGTPAIFGPDGSLIGGYLAPAELAAALGL